MKPASYMHIPNSLLEILDNRTDLLHFKNSHVNNLLQVYTMPYITLGTDIEITSLDVYDIDDNLITSTFDSYSKDVDGTMYYKAIGTGLAIDNNDKTYYYKINGDKYSQAFRLCAPEWMFRVWHEIDETFGLYNDGSNILKDEFSFKVESINDLIKVPKHTVIKANGVSHTAEAHFLNYIQIKSVVPYYMVRKLYQIQAFDNKQYVIGAGLGEQVFDIEDYIISVEGEGNTRTVTIEILPSTNIVHFAYNEEITDAGSDTPPGITINNTSGLLDTIVTDTTNYQIIWLKDGEQVGTGTSYQTNNVAGAYEAILLDTDTGERAADEHSIADVCENYSVSQEIKDIIDSNNKLIKLTVGGETEPVTYAWKYSSDNTTFTDKSETSNVLEADTTGYYKYIVTDDNGCQKVKVVYLVIASHSVTIDRNTNTLSAVVTGCATTSTYQWHMDTGSGYAPITGATSEDYEVEENALYKVVVTCDGQDAEAEKLILDLGGDIFRILINKVWLDAGTQKAYAELINAPSGLINIEWYQLKANAWAQIGSGDTVEVTEAGYLKALAKDDNGNVVIDEMALVTDPAKATEYNKFIISSALENEFEITAFTVPDPSLLTENEINAWYELSRNGSLALKYSSSAAADLENNEYGIDFPNNKVYISTKYAIYENEIIEFFTK